MVIFDHEIFIQTIFVFIKEALFCFRNQKYNKTQNSFIDFKGSSIDGTYNIVPKNFLKVLWFLQASGSFFVSIKHRIY